MSKKIILVCIFLMFCFSNSYAHDYDDEIIKYILTTPDASWSDFYEYTQTSESDSLKQGVENTTEKLEIVFSMVGKKHIAHYAEANPDFSYNEIKELIGDDPMLNEIGIETIYSYLKTTYSNPGNTTIDFDFFLRTIAIGFTHISAGYDHILFLLTLIVCLPAIRRILIIISTFTIAHCITLILGGLGLITLPSIIVESMILISIIIMGIYALKTAVGEKKNVYIEVTVIFILGLFHGLGFAGFFSGILETSENIIIPILGFNIGVELGQIIIMSIVLGVLTLVYKYFQKYKTYIKNTLSVLCILAASYWLLISFL